MILKKYYKNTVDIIVTTYSEWINDKAFRMAAALSFYSLISLAPFIFIITVAAGSIFGQAAVTGKLVSNIDNYVGVQSAELIQTLILKAYVPESGIAATVLSFLVLIWAGLAVFVEIRESLNTIWGIEIKPGGGLKEFFTGRLFSLLILFLIGILLILSLIVGTLIILAAPYIPDFISEIVPLLQWVDLLVSFILVTLLFVIIIKYLPSVKIEWKYALSGAVIFSVLFNLGSSIIGFYLTKTNYSIIYGAAGSLVILLLWIYYSSLIFFFGAELTQVIRKKFSNKPLIIDANVLNITKVAEQVKMSLSQ
jgi:membrane protein